MLRLEQREKDFARSLSRQCYIEADADFLHASALFKARSQAVSIDKDLLVSLQTFSMTLMNHWIEKGIDEPSVVASSDEPGYFNEEPNDAD
jgi:hypothetical protein